MGFVGWSSVTYGPLVGSPMSHVGFKKCLCRVLLFLEFPCQFQNNPMSNFVGFFKKKMSRPFFLPVACLGSLDSMSIVYFKEMTMSPCQ